MKITSKTKERQPVVPEKQPKVSKDLSMKIAEEVQPISRSTIEDIKKNEITIKFLKNPEIVEKMPAYAHDGDVGMDVVATGVEYLNDYDAYLYHTGLYCESDKNIGCFLMPRSSNMKTDAYLPNGIGLVDTAQYRNEICFVFKSRTDIEVVAAIYAMNYIGTLPFWKRLFVSFNKIWEEKIEELKKDPLYFAPYEVGDRIGQMVFFTHPTVKIEEVDELSETERGKGGFGSTGK